MPTRLGVALPMRGTVIMLDTSSPHVMSPSAAHGNPSAPASISVDAPAVRTTDDPCNEARFESERLLSAIASLLIGLDDEGLVTRWNESAAQLFSLDADAVLGRPLAELPIAWENGNELAEVLRARNQSASTKQVLHFRHPQSGRRTLGISIYPILIQGRQHGTVLLGTDVTEQTYLEHQLRQAQKLEAVGQLAAGVAHEINTPMQYIGDNLAYIQSAFEKIDPLLEAYEAIWNTESETRKRHASSQNDTSAENISDLATQWDRIGELREQIRLPKLLQQIPQALADAQDGVANVSRIVRAMKEFSHPGTDEKSLVDINHAIEATLTVARNEYKYVADLAVELAHDLPPVLGLPAELNQVLLNLVINAAHAISDRVAAGGLQRGTLTLRTRSVPSGVHIEVGDTGAGIPESIRDRILEPFFTTKAVGRGTGQGLALAHNVIVNKHAGRLWFDTELGQGSTFHVFLPSSENDSSPAPPPPNFPPPTEVIRS